MLVTASMHPLQERLAIIKREQEEDEERLRAEAVAKREEIEKKEKERNMPVDDSEMIVKLFGFLPTDQTALDGEGETPKLN